MNVKAKQLNKYWTDIYFHLHYAHEEKLSHQAIRIMQLIEKREGIAVGDIAAFLHVSPNTASEHVKRLIEKAYIMKVRDKKDERRVLLSLTKCGTEVLHRNTSLDEEKLAKVLTNLNEAESKQILEAFKLLSERVK